VPIVDDVEDGGRAIAIEEGIAAAVFDYASTRQWLEGLRAVDTSLLTGIRRLTRGLEVRAVTLLEWEQTILRAFDCWRGLRANNGGMVMLDLDCRTIEHRPLTDDERASHAAVAAQALELGLTVIMCIASPSASSKATLPAMTALPVQLSLPIHDSSPAYLEQRVRIPAPPPIRRQMDRWGATEVFDVYWQFAAERQRMYIRRLAGGPPPWTNDSILAQYRFTNPYRFSDRVSQHLLRHAQYDRPRPGATIVLRTLLFKVFNRVDTWESLVAEVGEPTVESFDPARYGRVLAALRDLGRRIYSPAYIVPNPQFGAEAKPRYFRKI
jgi:hypothetical protein